MRVAVVPVVLGGVDPPWAAMLCAATGRVLDTERLDVVAHLGEDAAAPAPASPVPTTMMSYFRLLFGATSFISRLQRSHFCSMGPLGTRELRTVLMVNSGSAGGGTVPERGRRGRGYCGAAGGWGCGCEWVCSSARAAASASSAGVTPSPSVRPDQAAKLPKPTATTMAKTVVTLRRIGGVFGVVHPQRVEGRRQAVRDADTEDERADEVDDLAGHVPQDQFCLSERLLLVAPQPMPNLKSATWTMMNRRTMAPVIAIVLSGVRPKTLSVRPGTLDFRGWP